MTQEEVIEILERFVIGAKPCSQREIVDACASAYRMLKEQPSLPSNLDEIAEKYSLDVKAKPFENLVKEAFKHGAIWRDSQIPKLPSNLDEAAEEIAKSEIPVEAGEALDSNGDCYETDDINWPERCGFIRGFKAGAEWMAGQGETVEGS